MTDGSWQTSVGTAILLFLSAITLHCIFSKQSTVCFSLILILFSALQSKLRFNEQNGKKPGPAKSDFDLLVRFYLKQYFTCPFDIYKVNSWKFPLVRTGYGTTWAIRTIDFAAPASKTHMIRWLTRLTKKRTNYNTCVARSIYQE